MASDAGLASPQTRSSESSVDAGLDRCVVVRSHVPFPSAPAGPRALRTVAVDFVECGNSRPPLRVTAELARRSADTEKGVMFRTSMPEDQGMLFDLGTRQIHTFWMRNTCIPLDMPFIDEDALIVGIVGNARTLDDGRAVRGLPVYACPGSERRLVPPPRRSRRRSCPLAGRVKTTDNRTKENP